MSEALGEFGGGSARQRMKHARLAERVGFGLGGRNYFGPVGAT
jgi:hypothetical protein